MEIEMEMEILWFYGPQIPEIPATWVDGGISYLHQLFVITELFLNDSIIIKLSNQDDDERE